jgi:hypothetical protein
VGCKLILKDMVDRVRRKLEFQPSNGGSTRSARPPAAEYWSDGNVCTKSGRVSTNNAFGSVVSVLLCLANVPTQGKRLLRKES